ncbi:MAG: hypothetical protein Ct9H90mP20_7050 [Candidatus Neomarinimicrobiota bacterium]|nr:MAG: hypothetical protein Ct9H90mP20_7050 [Candidatus Neomarinimicrobiota bacterium]
MHILIGELDDWVPAKACEELTEQAKSAGSNIGLTVFPNLHHSFDKKKPYLCKRAMHTVP